MSHSTPLLRGPHLVLDEPLDERGHLPLREIDRHLLQVLFAAEELGGAGLVDLAEGGFVDVVV